MKQNYIQLLTQHIPALGDFSANWLMNRCANTLLVLFIRKNVTSQKF